MFFSDKLFGQKLTGTVSSRVVECGTCTCYWSISGTLHFHIAACLVVDEQIAAYATVQMSVGGLKDLPYKIREIQLIISADLFLC